MLLKNIEMEIFLRNVESWDPTGLCWSSDKEAGFLCGSLVAPISSVSNGMLDDWEMAEEYDIQLTRSSVSKLQQWG